MAIATHGDLDPRPIAPDAANDVFEDTRRLFSGRPLAGPQQRQNRLAGGCLEDVDGLEDVLIIMGIEKRQLLAAMSDVRGVVDIENNACRNGREAIAEQIDHR